MEIHAFDKVAADAIMNLVSKSGDITDVSRQVTRIVSGINLRQQGEGTSYLTDPSIPFYCEFRDDGTAWFGNTEFCDVWGRAIALPEMIKVTLPEGLVLCYLTRTLQPSPAPYFYDWTIGASQLDVRKLCPGIIPLCMVHHTLATETTPAQITILRVYPHVPNQPLYRNSMCGLWTAKRALPALQGPKQEIIVTGAGTAEEPDQITTYWEAPPPHESVKIYNASLELQLYIAYNAPSKITIGNTGDIGTTNQDMEATLVFSLDDALTYYGSAPEYVDGKRELSLYLFRVPRKVQQYTVGGLTAVNASSGAQHEYFIIPRQGNNRDVSFRDFYAEYGNGSFGGRYYREWLQRMEFVAELRLVDYDAGSIPYLSYAGYPNPHDGNEDAACAIFLVNVNHALANMAIDADAGVYITENQSSTEPHEVPSTKLVTWDQNEEDTWDSTKREFPISEYFRVRASDGRPILSFDQQIAMIDGGEIITAPLSDFFEVVNEGGVKKIALKLTTIAVRASTGGFATGVRTIPIQEEDATNAHPSKAFALVE